MSVKTLEVCSLMPVESDLWFLNKFTDRDYLIMESDKPCPECDCTQIAVDEFETYCNECGKIFKKKYSYKSFKPFGYDMKSLKNHSLNLKNIDKDLIKIDRDNNKKYRNFKHRYYKLFLQIAENEYNINQKDANDLFYQYFRGFFDLNNKKGLKRKKLIHRFLDKININPRDYFITGVGYYNKDKDLYIIDDNGNRKLPEAGSRLPVVAEGQLNVTGKEFTGRKISYQQYLMVNDYPDTENFRIKYIKRYCKNYTLLTTTTVISNNTSIKSVAEPVTPVPTLTVLNPEEISIPLAINNYYKPKHNHTCAYCGSKISKSGIFCSVTCKALYYSVVDDLPVPISYNPDIFLVVTYNEGILYYPPIKKTNNNPDNETYKYLGDKKYYTRLNHTHKYKVETIYK